MQSPLFSVVIPTYNRAHVLRRSVDSVLRQTYRNFELLIIDDGSTDETKSLIEEYDDPRVRYLAHERNLGQNRALNTGIESARGELISFLDSDDEWMPEMLERVLEKFRSDPEFGCVYTLYAVRDLSGSIRAPIGSNLEGNIYKEALEHGEISPPSALTVRRRCFDVVGKFDPDIVVCQDDIMFLRLAKEFKFGRVDEVLANMYYDAGGRISENPVLSAKGYYALAELFVRDVVKHCGRAAAAKQYEHAGKLFLRVGDQKMAICSFWRGVTRGLSLMSALYALFALLPEELRTRIRPPRH